MKPEPNVFVVDDDPAMVEAVMELVDLIDLKGKPYYSADQFLEEFEPTGPACLVLDVRMPGMSGMELQQELAKTGKTLPIVMITGHGDIRMAVEAMKAGATEFLEKPFRSQELCDAIQRAVRSECDNWHRRQQRKNVDCRFEGLTSAEREVMELVVAGKTNKMIAEQLGLSVRAVEDRRARMMKKLRLSNRAELMELVAAAEPV